MIIVLGRIGQSESLNLGDVGIKGIKVKTCNQIERRLPLTVKSEKV